MRRMLAMSAVVVLVMAMSAGVGLAVSDYYKDTFDSGNYSGSQGTVSWPGPWTEIGDDNSHSGGKVMITSSGCSGSCLLIDWGVAAVTDTGIRRSVDLVLYTGATLSYELDVELATIPLTTAILRVEALDGSNWRTLRTHVLATSEGSQSPSASMDVVAGKSSAIRFVVSGILDGSVRVDDVKVSLVAPSTTTTSTTSTTSTTTTTTTVTLPPTTLPTVPTVTTTSTTLPGGPGLPTSTTTAIPGESPETSTTIPSGAGGTGGGTAPPSGSGGEAGSPPGQTDPNSLPDPGGAAERQVVAPIALDVVADGSSGQIEILDADYSADFSLAAEVFDLLGIGPLLLAGIISALALVGIDRRRAPTALTWRRSEDDS